MSDYYRAIDLCKREGNYKPLMDYVKSVSANQVEVRKLPYGYKTIRP